MDKDEVQYPGLSMLAVCSELFAQLPNLSGVLTVNKLELGRLSRWESEIIGAGQLTLVIWVELVACSEACRGPVEHHQRHKADGVL